MLIEKLLKRIESWKAFFKAWYKGHFNNVEDKKTMWNKEQFDFNYSASKRQTKHSGSLSNHTTFNQLKTDEARAFKWYKKAAEAGSREAMNEMAKYYAYGVGGIKKDEKEAMKWSEKAREAENSIFNLVIHCVKENQFTPTRQNN